MKTLYKLIILLFSLTSSVCVFSQMSVPPAAQIKNISVEPTDDFPGRVYIRIDTTGTLKSSRYIIRRYFNTQSDTGFIGIDTLSYGQNMSYHDYTANAHLNSEWYDILTQDSLTDDISDASIKHKTIYLATVNNDSCNKLHKVAWTRYYGENGLDYQVIIDDNQPTPPNAGDTIYENDVEFNQEYNYQIYAWKGSNFRTFSNILTDSTLPLIPVNQDKFEITNIHNTGSELTVNCNVDTLAHISQYNLMAQNNDVYELIDSTQNTLLESIELKHNTSITEKFYKIEAINTCESVTAKTDSVKPIILASTSNNNVVTLNWNSSYGSIETYELHMIIDSDASKNFELGTDQFFELDLNQSEYVNHEHFQFQITATETSGHQSISNVVDQFKNPKIIMYDAFTPNGDGKNDDIGPTIVNASVKSFEFIVYNRFGEIIYNSTNENDTNWDGTYKGSYVNEGAYLYYVKVSTELDKKIEKSGVIHVIYP